MSDAGDFELGPPPDDRDEPASEPEEPGHDGPPPILFIGAGLLMVVVAVVLYFLLRGKPAAPPSAPARVTATAPPAAATPTPEPVELPSLANSDDFVRRLAAALSASPDLAAWLATPHLVRTFVMAVDNVADGASPARALRFMAPEGEFAVAGSGGTQSFIDPRSYRRYDRVAAVVGSLDARGCARLVRLLRPLMDEAYRDLGYPDRDFGDTLTRALRMLIDAPVPEGEVGVVPRVVSFRFADPRLEALPDAQKHLVRMGSKNARVVQAKLAEIAEALAAAPGRGVAEPDPATPAP